MESKEKMREFTCLSNKMDFSDFILEAKIKKVSGSDSDYFGIAFRMNHSNGYIFSISEDGHFALWSMVNGKRTPLIRDLRGPPFINKENDYKILKVKCNGSEISLYVNTNFLAEVRDGDEYFDRGKVGFWVQELIYSNIINVDYLKISKLDTFQEKRVENPLTNDELAAHFKKYRLLFSNGDVQIVQKHMLIGKDKIFVLVGGRQISWTFGYGIGKSYIHIGDSMENLLLDIKDYKKEVEVRRVTIIKDIRLLLDDEYYILVDNKVVLGPLSPLT